MLAKYGHGGSPYRQRLLWPIDVVDGESKDGVGGNVLEMDGQGDPFIPVPACGEWLVSRLCRECQCLTIGKDLAHHIQVRVVTLM